MKKQLLKKLYAFIVTAMLFSASANAQIIYTDVNPDIIQTCPNYQCSKSYNLDLNNDGIIDFTLSTYSNYTTCFPQGYVSTKSVSIFSQSGNLAAANYLSANASVGSSLSFTTNSVILRRVGLGGGGIRCTPLPTTGSWTSTSDGYVGLQITVGSNTYYGWVRLNVVVDQFVSTVSCIVKDYAYNSIPNQPIFAGQTTCPLPTVNVSASGATTFCYGSPLTLTADSASGYTFQWQKNTVAISGATARTYKVTTSGNYTVTTTKTCSTATSTPLSCTRIFNQTPVISTSDSLAYCAGQAINTKFTANTYTAVTYQWQKNSVNINGAIAPNFTATTTGNYRVRETANGCTRNSSAKSIAINCRIGEDFSNESLLSIYPNPAINYITIQFPYDQSAIISITNLFGQLVYSEKVNAELTQIDVSRFAAGIYMIRLGSKENFETKTFSVIK